MPSNESRATEITVIILLMVVLILVPPTLDLWSDSENPWYIPYLVWLGIIALGYLLQRILRKHAI